MTTVANFYFKLVQLAEVVRQPINIIKFCPLICLLSVYLSVCLLYRQFVSDIMSVLYIQLNGCGNK